MLHIQSINSSLVQRGETTWAVASNLFDSEQEHYLAQSYPTEGFVRQVRESGPKKHYSFSLKNLVIENNFIDSGQSCLDKAWINLAQILMSNEYIEAVSQRLNLNLKDSIINIGFYKFEKGDWVSPHIDNPEKILTQIFYFNEVWSTNWGGFFKLLNSQHSDDTSFSVPPLSIFSTFIARSDASWHMVTPVEVEATQPRRSMQLEFIKRCK